jgi:hypothetical protein
MQLLTALLAPPPPDPDPSPVASLVVTFVPMLLIVGMFLLFLRVLRRTTARAEEALKLTREIVSELRAIRTAVERQPPV